MTGNVAAVEDDATLESSGFVGNRALACRKPDDGASIATSVPLDKGFLLRLTDGVGNDLDGSGIGAPDDIDDDNIDDDD